MSILQTIDLKIKYGAEPNITRALDGVIFPNYNCVLILNVYGKGVMPYGLAF